MGVRWQSESAMPQPPSPDRRHQRSWPSLPVTTERVAAKTADFAGPEQVAPGVRWDCPGDDRLGYRLDVIASNVTAVVRGAGGWLCDRAMAGWDVNVVLPSGRDIRPLQILGLKVVHMDWQLAPARASTSRCLAVGADVFGSDTRVRAAVLAALDQCLTEVTLFDDDCPAILGRRMTVVQHVLSSAARLFKGHALAAAGVLHEPAGPTETLLSDMKASLPVGSELIPLS